MNYSVEYLQNVIYHHSYYSLSQVSEAKRQLKLLGFNF